MAGGDQDKRAVRDQSEHDSTNWDELRERFQTLQVALLPHGHFFVNLSGQVLLETSASNMVYLSLINDLLIIDSMHCEE